MAEMAEQDRTEPILKRTDSENQNQSLSVTAKDGLPFVGLWCCTLVIKLSNQLLCIGTHIVRYQLSQCQLQCIQLQGSQLNYMPTLQLTKGCKDVFQWFPYSLIGTRELPKLFQEFWTNFFSDDFILREILYLAGDALYLAGHTYIYLAGISDFPARQTA
ncbi:hypothetical protein B0H13DRAFT_2261454 [Mycena leptocephala]|nr:hypothetical protein B0H13DRAFT_2261454 [Mycena leptocephala]